MIMKCEKLFFFHQNKQKVSTIALAKPDRAKMLENILITNAQRGAIREKVIIMMI